MKRIKKRQIIRNILFDNYDITVATKKICKFIENNYRRRKYNRKLPLDNEDEVNRVWWD